MKTYFTTRNVFLLMIFIGIITLLLTPFIRFFNFNSLMVGEESYYHARMARYLIEHGIPEKDELVTGIRPYIIEPYHLVLSRVGYLLGTEFSSQLLPLLSGLISLIIFHSLLANLKFNNESIFYILIILILSPHFLGIFSYSSPGALAILFTLLGIYFFLKEDMLSFSLSIFFLIISAFFSFIAPFIALAVLLSYSFYKKHMLRLYLLLFCILTFFIIFYSSVLYWKYGLPNNVNFLPKNFFQRFFSDMGDNLGFSVFSLILSGLGLVFTWGQKRKLYIIYLTIFALFVLTIFNDLPNIYLNFFISVFSGIGVYYLIKRKWTMYLIKELTILAIFCGLLFSSISYLSRLATTNPSKNVVDSLVWLNVNSKRNEIVLSHFSKGYWIEFLADRKVILDNDFSYIPDALERFENANKIFYGRNLRETKRLLELYNVTYIWIDKDMKEGLVWNKPDEGLLYMLRNNQTFRNIYQERDISIWKYIG